MTGAANSSDGRWLDAVQVSLTIADVADALAVAIGARLRLPADWGWTPRAAGLAVLVVVAGLAFRLAPLDIAAGVASLCVMAASVAFGRVPHGLLMLMMAPAAWVTVRRHAGSMNAFVAWGRTGLHAAGQGSSTITLWSEMDGWGERRTLVLRKPAAGYVVIPKRCLTIVQADAIRGFLQTAGVPKFGHPDLRPTAEQTGGEPRLLGPPGPRRTVFRLTVADLAAARRFVILDGLLTRSTAGIAILVVFAAWWTGWTEIPGRPIQTLIWAAAAGLASVIGLRLVLPLLITRGAVGRSYRRQRGIGEDCQFDWDEAEFRCAYVNGDVQTPWAEVRRWHLAKTFVFLSLGPASGQVIPRRALDPAQLADLETCAAAAHVRGAGRRALAGE